MKVAYTEMKDACLDRVAVEGIRFDCVCCHFYFYAVSCYFLAFSLLAYKVRVKNNVGKEMFYEKNGNVSANVPKICKRFKSGDPLGR